MKIIRDREVTRREHDKAYRQERKDRYDKHEFKLRIYRRWRMLAIRKLKRDGVRQTASLAKLPRGPAASPLKYLRARRKMVPLPFTPLSQQLLSPSANREAQCRRYVFIRKSPKNALISHRNEVRNPSAVYLLNDTTNKLEPVREAMSSSFTEFIDWDYAAFQEAGPLPKETPPAVHPSIETLGEKEALPIQPLELVLPPLEDDDMGYQHEHSPDSLLDLSHAGSGRSDRLHLSMFSVSNGLDSLEHAAYPTNRPLVLAGSSVDWQALPLASSLSTSPVDPFLSGDSLSGDPHMLSADAGLRVSSSAFEPVDVPSSISHNELYLQGGGVPAESLVMDNLTGFHTQSQLARSLSSSRSRRQSRPHASLPSSDSTRTVVAPSYTFASALSSRLFQAFDDSPISSGPSVATLRPIRSIGERLAASVSSSSSRLRSSLGDNIVKESLPLHSHTTLSSASGNDFLRISPATMTPSHPMSSSSNALMKPTFSEWFLISGSPSLICVIVGFVDPHDRCSYAVQCMAERFAASTAASQARLGFAVSDEIDLEMQALPGYSGKGAGAESESWSATGIFRSIVHIMTAVFLCPWQVALDVLVHGS